MTGSIIIGIIAGIIGIIIGYLYAQGKSRLIAGQKELLSEQVKQKENESAILNQKLQEQISLRSRYEAEAARIPELEGENYELRQLKTQLAESETARKKDHESIDQKLALLDEAKQKLTEAFGVVSSKALSDNSKDFLTLANSNFSSRQEQLDDLLKPVKENLTKLEAFNREIEEKRIGAYSSLETHIKNLHESEQFLRAETSQLVNALRQPTTRGAWGEQQLRRVLEMAGVEENVHFNEQVDMVIDNQKRRADLVLHLADGKHIVVDSKAPVQTYMDVVSATTKEERDARLKTLANNIRTYAKDLNSIQYWKYYDDSPGIVVMFIPSESILNAAMQADATLWEECTKKRILLASPTTLVAILYSIAFGWRQDAFEKNAKEIKNLAEKIYDRLSVFGKHFHELGSQLKKSVDKYNDSVGSLETSVLPSAREMSKLGIEKGKNIIPDLSELDAPIRNLRTPELLLSLDNKIEKS